MSVPPTVPLGSHRAVNSGEWNLALKVSFMRHCRVTAYFLQNILSRPQPLTIHTIILPPGYTPSTPALQSARIVEEKVYKLKPGELPDVATRPAPVFDAYIEPGLAATDWPAFISVSAPMSQRPPTT